MWYKKLIKLRGGLDLKNKTGKVNKRVRIPNDKNTFLYLITH